MCYINVYNWYDKFRVDYLKMYYICKKKEAKCISFKKQTVETGY